MTVGTGGVVESVRRKGQRRWLDGCVPRKGKSVGVTAGAGKVEDVADAAAGAE
ncbi:hypothetical protein [Paenibacillus sp. BC26]|uniref:hypothetical protein n=1 Tax=Paenibacillus sp. BC26 TaxID=1881032 RepID=UPI0015A51116|nr:hypothetical protein [Paenibacillus sp. BC26]